MGRGVEVRMGEEQDGLVEVSEGRSLTWDIGSRLKLLPKGEVGLV